MKTFYKYYNSERKKKFLSTLLKYSSPSEGLKFIQILKRHNKVTVLAV